MRRFSIVSLIVLLFAFAGCDEDVTDFNPDGDARYMLTFTGIWTIADHGNVPGNAHFTQIIGTTHNQSVHLFELGASASAGIEEVAETGSTGTASGEIDGLINGGNAFSKLVISVSSGPLGAGQGEFTVSEDRPFVSAASMIAPSPDWFVGLRDFKLYDAGVWVSDTTFNLGMYDAGTEDGDQLSLDNPATDPRGTISSLTEMNASVLSDGSPGIAPIATVRLKRIE